MRWTVLVVLFPLGLSAQGLRGDANAQAPQHPSWLAQADAAPVDLETWAGDPANRARAWALKACAEDAQVARGKQMEADARAKAPAGGAPDADALQTAKDLVSEGQRQGKAARKQLRSLHAPMPTCSTPEMTQQLRCLPDVAQGKPAQDDALPACKAPAMHALVTFTGGLGD